MPHLASQSRLDFRGPNTRMSNTGVETGYLCSIHWFEINFYNPLEYLISLVRDVLLPSEHFHKHNMLDGFELFKEDTKNWHQLYRHESGLVIKTGTKWLRPQMERGEEAHALEINGTTCEALGQDRIIEFVNALNARYMECEYVAKRRTGHMERISDQQGSEKKVTLTKRGYSIRRIDLAVDTNVFDMKRFTSWVDDGHIVTRVRDPNLQKNSLGTTHYFGARGKSDKFLRVYDKRGPLRFEVEITKDKYGLPALDDFVKDRNSALSWIRTVIDSQQPEWIQLMEKSSPVKLAYSDDSKTHANEYDRLIANVVRSLRTYQLLLLVEPDIDLNALIRNAISGRLQSAIGHDSLMDKADRIRKLMDKYGTGIQIEHTASYTVDPEFSGFE